MSGDRIVTDFLTEHFAKEYDILTRLLFYIHSESTENALGNTPVGSFLYKLISEGQSEDLVKNYLGQVVEDTKTSQKGQKYRKYVNDLYEGMNMDPNIIDPEVWANRVALRVTGEQISLFRKVITSLARMRPQEWETLCESVKSTAGSSVLQVIPTSIGLLKDTGRQVAVVAIVAVELCYTALKSIIEWWNGEISGKYCAKKVVDSTCSIVTGAGGGIAGQAVGSMVGTGLGPAGSAVGGLVGGFIGASIAAKAAETLMNALTSWLFDLPKSEALEKSYKFLGASSKVDNAAINSRYRKMALECHPDKPAGSHEKWIKLQTSLAIIKQAREEK